MLKRNGYTIIELLVGHIHYCDVDKCIIAGIGTG